MSSWEISQVLITTLKRNQELAMACHILAPPVLSSCSLDLTEQLQSSSSFQVQRRKSGVEHRRELWLLYVPETGEGQQSDPQISIHESDFAAEVP